VATRSGLVPVSGALIATPCQQVLTAAELISGTDFRWESPGFLSGNQVSPLSLGIRSGIPPVSGVTKPPPPSRWPLPEPCPQPCPSRGEPGQWSPRLGILCPRPQSLARHNGPLLSSRLSLGTPCQLSPAGTRSLELHPAFAPLLITFALQPVRVTSNDRDVSRLSPRSAPPSAPGGDARLSV
jgi:hypothetical protein